MPIFKFFYFKKIDDEILFQEQLAKAIALIGENNSLIARDVLRILESNTLIIRSFFALSSQHFMDIMNDMSASNISIPIDYPPSRETIRRIEQYLEGIIFSNHTIYINSNRSIESIAKTLIHEVSHFLNTDILKNEISTQGVAQARYNDELRSFIAERVFDRDGTCLLRSDVKKIHARVTSSYPEFSQQLDEQPQGYLYSTYDTPRL